MPVPRRAPWRALTLAAFASCPAAASAASAAFAADAPTVDSVIVTARPNPEDPPVVAATRRRLSETPGAVAVVSAESYERRYASNLADVLRDVPGVYARKKMGRGRAPVGARVRHRQFQP